MGYDACHFPRSRHDNLDNFFMQPMVVVATHFTKNTNNLLIWRCWCCFHRRCHSPFALITSKAQSLRSWSSPHYNNDSDSIGGCTLDKE